MEAVFNRAGKLLGCSLFVGLCIMYTHTPGAKSKQQKKAKSKTASSAETPGRRPEPMQGGEEARSLSAPCKAGQLDMTYL